MKKVVIVEVDVRSYMRSDKVRAAQDKINEYIRNNQLDVTCVSLFKENEDKYLFTLTLQ